LDAFALDKDAKSLRDKTPLRDPCVRKLLIDAEIKRLGISSKGGFTKHA
jgi:hypothetical protein